MLLYLRWRVLVAVDLAQSISCRIEDKIWRVVAEKALTHVHLHPKGVSPPVSCRVVLFDVRTIGLMGEAAAASFTMDLSVKSAC